MSPNNKIVFILTNLAFQAITGNFGTYSIMKHPMAVTYDYDQQYLGILEAVQLLAQILGSLSILFILVKPVKGYLMFAILNTIFAILLCFPRYINQKIWRDILVQISFFGQSALAASVAFTQIIFSYFFDQNAKKCEHSVWFSLTFLGEVISLIFAQVLVYNIGLRWQFVNVIWHAYIVAIGVLMYIYIGDEINAEDQLDQILNQQNQNGQINNSVIEPEQQHINKIEIRKQSKFNLCIKLCKTIKNILRQPRIFFIVISFGLIQGIYANMLYWVPYYYIITNHQTYSGIAILGITLSIVVGGVLLEIILFQIIKLQDYSKPITYFMLLISSILYFIIWTKRYDEPLVQVILLFVANFFLGCPYSRISAAEPIQQAEGDQHKLKTIFLLAHLSRNVVIAIFVIAIGFFMKRNSMSFWSIILINVGLALIVQTIRTFILKKKQEKQIIQKQQN